MIYLVFLLVSEDFYWLVHVNNHHNNFIVLTLSVELLEILQEFICLQEIIGINIGSFPSLKVLTFSAKNRLE